jgi:hypothetical protein
MLRAVVVECPAGEICGSWRGVELPEAPNGRTRIRKERTTEA